MASAAATDERIAAFLEPSQSACTYRACNICFFQCHCFALTECADSGAWCWLCELRLAHADQQAQVAHYCRFCKQPLARVELSQALQPARDAPLLRRFGVFVADRALLRQLLKLANFYCWDCHKKFADLASWRKHQAAAHRKQPCLTCLERRSAPDFLTVAYTDAELRAHVAPAQPSALDHVRCPVCAAICYDRAAFEQHWKASDNHFECHFCAANAETFVLFGSYAALEAHLRAQHVACAQCAEFCRDEHDFLVHCSQAHAQPLSLDALQRAAPAAAGSDVATALRELGRQPLASLLSPKALVELETVEKLLELHAGDVHTEFSFEDLKAAYRLEERGAAWTASLLQLAETFVTDPEQLIGVCSAVACVHCTLARFNKRPKELPLNCFLPCLKRLSNESLLLTALLAYIRPDCTPLLAALKKFCAQHHRHVGVLFNQSSAANFAYHLSLAVNRKCYLSPLTQFGDSLLFSALVLLQNNALSALRQFLTPAYLARVASARSSADILSLAHVGSDFADKLDAAALEALSRLRIHFADAQRLVVSAAVTAPSEDSSRVVHAALKQWSATLFEFFDALKSSELFQLAAYLLASKSAEACRHNKLPDTTLGSAEFPELLQSDSGFVAPRCATSHRSVLNRTRVARTDAFARLASTADDFCPLELAPDTQIAAPPRRSPKAPGDHTSSDVRANASDKATDAFPAFATLGGAAAAPPAARDWRTRQQQQAEELLNLMNRDRQLRRKF